jgi:spore coat polysaccharide biosynthesis protein SpsF
MAVGRSNKIVAIIQARMQSTRLPGKVLMPMPFTSDTSILGQILNQLKKSKFNPIVIVATSISKADDKIANFCATNNTIFFRGDEDNVHSRFFEILQNSEYKIAIRVTGDNPIIDIESLDFVIENHIESHSDYSYTANLPVGMNFEVFDVKSFLKMSTMGLTNEDKEHVTLKFKTDDSFLKKMIDTKSGIEPNIRVTIDYPSDYLMLSFLYDIAKQNHIEPGIKLIQFVLKEYSWVFQVNESNFQKKQFATEIEEVSYSIGLLDSIDLKKSAQYLSNYASIQRTK